MRIDGSYVTADHAQQVARVVEEAVGAGALDDALEHGGRQVRLPHARLPFEEQPPRHGGKRIGHRASLGDGPLQGLVVGAEIVERAVLIALRDARGVKQILPELIAPAVAPHDAPRAVVFDGSPSRVVAMWARHRAILSVQVTAQLRRSPEFFLRARFDLPYALARQVKTVADFLQRVLLIVFEAEAEPHDLALLAVQIR